MIEPSTTQRRENMTQHYVVSKTSLVNKKLITVYYSTTGKFIKSAYHAALMMREQAEKVASQNGAAIRAYTFKHQH
jgi:hypothetical protein